MKVKVELEINLTLNYNKVKIIKINNSKGLQLIFNNEVKNIPLSKIKDLQVEDNEITVY